MSEDRNYVGFDETVEIVAGFLSGAFKARGLDYLSSCITKVDDVALSADMTHEDCSAVLNDRGHCVMDFAELARDVRQSIDDCPQVKYDAFKLAMIINVFSSPFSFSGIPG